MGDQSVKLELLQSAFFYVKQLMNLFRIYSLDRTNGGTMVDVGIMVSPNWGNVRLYSLQLEKLL